MLNDKMTELQKILEKEDYRFLTNLSLNSGYELEPERDENGYYDYKRYVYRTRDVSFTDSELIEKVKDLGKYSEIRLEKAFDVSGKQLPNYKAVFVK